MNAKGNAMETGTVLAWTLGKNHNDEPQIWQSDGRLIATFHHECVDEKGAIANAKLAIASRELLALLEEAIPYIEECEQFHKEGCRTLSKRARAAIAKATGATP